MLRVYFSPSEEALEIYNTSEYGANGNPKFYIREDDMVDISLEDFKKIFGNTPSDKLCRNQRIINEEI